MHITYFAMRRRLLQNRNIKKPTKNELIGYLTINANSLRHLHLQTFLSWGHTAKTSNFETDLNSKPRLLILFNVRLSKKNACCG